MIKRQISRHFVHHVPCNELMHVEVPDYMKSIMLIIPGGKTPGKRPDQRFLSSARDSVRCHATPRDIQCMCTLSPEMILEKFYLWVSWLQRYFHISGLSGHPFRTFRSLRHITQSTTLFDATLVVVKRWLWTISRRIKALISSSLCSNLKWYTMSNMHINTYYIKWVTIAYI